MVNQDRHQANQQLDDHHLAMDKQSASINAKLTALFDDFDAKLQ
jgi:hypothetical protein